MKTICFFPTLMLPVPAVKGGAIETLINLLIDENEKNQKFNFLVISIYDSIAYEKSKNYKYTKFLYIKPRKFHTLFDLIYRGITKFFNIRIPYLSTINYLAFNKMKKIDFDYIIAEGGNYYNFSLFKKKYGTEKIVAHIHHHYKPKPILGSYFGKVIAISNFVKKEWLLSAGYNEKNMVVLKNSIDLSKFQRKSDETQNGILKKSLGFSEDDFIVFYCGRIVKEKGIKELIEAFKTIKDSSIKLMIVGSPNFGLESKSDFLSEINKLLLELNSNYNFTGYIDNNELYKYYAIADVTVMPSLCEEAAGLVAIESMSTGTPLITTNTGGLIEYIDETCAMILDRDQNLINKIASSILELKEDTVLRKQMGANGKKIAEKYNSTTYFKNFTNIFSKDTNGEVNHDSNS